MAVFKPHSGILRLSVLCAVALAAVATTRVLRSPFETYNISHVPSFLFIVVCDTTGVRTQRLEDDLAANANAMASEERLYADLVQRESHDRDAATREAWFNAAYGLQDSLYQSRFAESKQMIAAANARYKYLVTQKAEMESASGRRRHTDVYRRSWVPMTLLDQSRWNWLGGPPQYTRFYDCKLRWFSYALVPLAAGLAGYLAAGLAGHVVILLTAVSVRLFKWVIVGFLPKPRK